MHAGPCLFVNNLERLVLSNVGGGKSNPPPLFTKSVYGPEDVLNLIVQYCTQGKYCPKPKF